MNELQVRITGELSALQSALAKAKKSIIEFEKQSESETNKTNVKYQRKLGLLEKLDIKAKALRVSLKQATNERDVEQYNRELEDVVKQMTRLNALGRQVSNSLGSANNGFNQATQSIGSANGVALEFNRIIQDAPFGIIGIGNNLQQLAGNFSQASKQAGGAGKAIAASFTALLSPANLALLAISAITAGFTAYQMGAFDSLFANEELGKSYEELANDIESATANAAVETIKINSLREVIEDETLARDERLKAVNRLQDKYPSIFANADKEKLLNGQLTESYELLAKAIIQRAKQSIAEQELPALIKQKALVDSDLVAKEKLLETEESLLNTRSKLTGITQAFSGSDFEQAQKRIIDLKKEVDELSVAQKGLQINIDGYTGSIIEYTQEFEPLLQEPKKQAEELIRTFDTFPEKINRALEGINLEKLDLFSQGAEAPLSISSGAAETQGIIIPDFATKFEEQANKIQDIVSELSGSFTGLGSLIGKAFDNTGLGTFIGEFLRFSAKLIAANFKIATANAIAGASQSAQATGPAAAFTLPAFIAGAVGLIASAFAAIGGGGSKGSVSGGGFGASSTPTIFTNQNTVSPPTPNSPSNTPFDASIDNAQGRIVPMFTWDGFYVEYKTYENRRNNG